MRSMSGWMLPSDPARRRRTGIRSISSASTSSLFPLTTVPGSAPLGWRALKGSALSSSSGGPADCLRAALCIRLLWMCGRVSNKGSALHAPRNAHTHVRRSRQRTVVKEGFRDVQALQLHEAFKVLNGHRVPAPAPQVPQRHQDLQTQPQSVCNYRVIQQPATTWSQDK